MQIKFKVKLLNNNIILVDPETLNFIENPDITSILQTSEEYYQELENIEPLQLEHLLALQSLSPFQEEMMNHYYFLHHIHFPKLIVMAEKGIIPKCLASLKGRCPICVACLLVRLINIHGTPSWHKNILLSLLMMHLVKEHQWRSLFLLNLD
jgi:hypothetical protein